jgi:hypothetical protein
MAERELSGKALLNKLYSGLNTMPVVETELSTRDLRSLNDEFLGKPAEVAASSQSAAKPSQTSSNVRPVSNARPVSRAKKLRAPLVMLISGVALAGVIAAATLRESDRRAALPPPPPPVVEVAPAPQPEMQVAETPAPQPVVVVNPFDKTEKFTFPPGTSKAEAREQMAEMLMQRAVERRAHIPRARKLAAEPRTTKTGRGS